MALLNCLILLEIRVIATTSTINMTTICETAPTIAAMGIGIRVRPGGMIVTSRFGRGRLGVGGGYSGILRQFY